MAQEVGIEIYADTKDAVKQLDKLEKTLDEVDKATGKAGKKAAKASKDVDNLGRQAKKAEKSFSRLKTTLAGVFTLASARGAVLALESVQSLDQRIKLATQTTQEFSKAQKELRGLALETGASLGVVGDVFGRLGLIKSTIKATNEEIITSTEALVKLGIVSGATADQLGTGLTQIIQDLGQGALRAEGFNSAVENTPGVLAAIAKQLGLTTAELGFLAKNGGVEASKVFQAIVRTAKEARIEFEELAPSASRAFSALNTQIALSINEIEQASGLIASLVDGIKAITPALRPVAAYLVSTAKTIKLLFVALGEGIAATASFFANVIPPTLSEVALGIGETFTQIIKNLLIGVQRLANESVQTIIATFRDAFENLPDRLGGRAIRSALDEALLSLENSKIDFVPVTGIDRIGDALKNVATQAGEFADVWTKNVTPAYNAALEANEKTWKLGVEYATATGETAKSASRTTTELERQAELLREITRLADQSVSKTGKFKDLNKGPGDARLAYLPQSDASLADTFLGGNFAEREEIRKQAEEARRAVIRLQKGKGDAAGTQRLLGRIDTQEAKDIADLNSDLSFTAQWMDELEASASSIADSIAQWATGMEQSVSWGRQLAALIVQITTQAAINSLTNALTGGGGGIGGAAPTRASGGSVAEGSIYRVNDEAGRPEVFTDNAGRSYLMPGSSGMVSRMQGAGSVNQRIIVNNNAPGAEVQVTRNDDEIIEIAVSRAVAASRRDFSRSMATGYGEYSRSLSKSYSVKRSL